MYLESLKNKLIQANVPQDEWKLLLISHLTGKYLVMIQDIEADPGYGFEECNLEFLIAVASHQRWLDSSFTSFEQLMRRIWEQHS